MNKKQIIKSLEEQRERIELLQLGSDHDGAFQLGKEDRELANFLDFLKDYNWKEEV